MSSRCAESHGPVVPPAPSPAPDARSTAGFTLLELVVAVTLFAFIIVYVLADRETSIAMSGDARNMQIVRYLAAMKIDEIRHDPEQFGERDSGDFEDLNTDWQDYSAYSWELEIETVSVVGEDDDQDVPALYEDEDDDPSAVPTDSEGNPLEARYVRRLVFTVRYEPDGVENPELSIELETYLPPEEEEAPQ